MAKSERNQAGGNHWMLITGAARGIGRAIALRFAEAGWQVLACDIDNAELAQLAADAPDSLHTAQLDVTRSADWGRVLGDLRARSGGRLDLLVNNAGVLVGGKLAEIELERQLVLVDINVKGVLIGCHAAHGLLKASPGARLINLASASALYGQPGLAIYSASKFAVRALTEALDIEWADDDIRVADVMPLFVHTDMLDDAGDLTSMRKMGVHLTPDDVANRVWQMAHSRRRRVHWTIGATGWWLALGTKLSPAAINRWIVRRLATDD